MDKLEPVVNTVVVVVVVSADAVGRSSLPSFNGRVMVVETVTKMFAIAGYLSGHHDVIVFQARGQLG